MIKGYTLRYYGRVTAIKFTLYRRLVCIYIAEGLFRLIRWISPGYVKALEEVMIAKLNEKYYGEEE